MIRKRRSHEANPGAAARERRFDAIQRRRNPHSDGELVQGDFGSHRRIFQRGEQRARRLANQAPDISGCCIDPVTGLITCPGGKDQWAFHGEVIPPETLVCIQVDNGGPDFCVVTTPNGAFDVPQCPSEPPPPTKLPPPECCYDVASGKLRCEPPGSAWDGLEVSLLALQPQDDGSIAAIVMSEAFAPEDSTQIFPVCDDPVTECCYDTKTQTLMCTDEALNGTPAGVLAAWVGQDGQLYVWAAWEGGAARMPLCPGSEECPPVFCCVHLQTFNFICPGQPELNGQPAPIADIVTEDGYSWAVLEDGSRVPMCGEQCPPPQLCPECPTCPPGEWMSPDGTCSKPPSCPPPDEPCPPGMWRDPTGNCVSPPQCPECPPGTLLNTQTGECVTCPQCPPSKGCCDGCANGGPCKRPPTQRSRRVARNPHRRKRRILAGNR